MKTIYFWLAGLFLSAFILTGCGGGGGGGSSPAAPAETTVSGTVQTPGGQVALNGPQILRRFVANLILSEAHADLTGLSAVPDGTKVQLARIDPVTGLTLSEIASTTTSKGRFSFNLTQLGVGLSNTLIAQLAEETGIKLRAFVVDNVVNLEPVSEAVVETILDEIAKDPTRNLDRFTVMEIKALVGIADFSTGQSGLPAGVNTGSSVTNTKTFLAGNSDFSSNLQSALREGESAATVVDPLNLFPLTVGNNWEYKVTSNNAGVTETETLKVTGTKEIKGVQTSVLARFKQFNPGFPDREEFFHKDASGIQYFGDGNPSSAKVDEQTIPYLRIKLPAKLGEVVSEVDKRSLDLGSDLDGDGKNESLESYFATHTPIGFESISTPAGQFRCLKVVENATIVVKSTGTAVRLTSKVTDVWWLAPGVGIVKETLDIDSTATNGFNLTTNDTRELQRATVDDVVYPGAARIKAIALTHNDVVYDASRDRLYASVPSSVGATGNSIAIIDPNSASILQSIPIGSEPSALGLSKDSKFLYVGLDGSGQISKLNLSTLESDLSFNLGLDVSGTQKYARRIEVLNGNANSFAVGWGYPFDTSIRGVSIFDGSTKRTREIPTAAGEVSSANAFTLTSDDGNLYADSYGTGPSVQAIRRFKVDALGLTLSDPNPISTTITSRTLTLDNRRLYSDTGTVFDLDTLGLAGTYLAAGACVPDSAKGRTYCISNNASVTAKLTSFDLTNFQPVEGVELGTSSNFGQFSKLVRWGASGIAVSEKPTFFATPSTGKLYLVTSVKLVP